MGVPSFAISVAGYEEEVQYEYAGSFAAFLAGLLLRNPLPPSVLLNVNVPAVPTDQIAGIEVTRQGKRHYAGRLEKRTDPMGRTYYWLGGDAPIDELEEGTDVKAIADDKVSITPIHLDLTSYPALEVVKSWEVEDFNYVSTGKE